MRMLTGLFVLQIGRGLAQLAGAPSFEVASVRMVEGPCSAQHACTDDIKTTPIGLTAYGVPLGLLIRLAYGLHLHQQPPIETVGPAWIEPGGDWIRYDVIAKADGPTTIANLRAMLRALLAERLKLRTHWDTKSLPVYVLSRSKSELKLRQSTAEVENKFTPPLVPPGENWWWGIWRFEGFDTDGIKEFLWPFLPTVVEDETGLKGRFEFSFNVGKYRDFYEPPEPGGRADLGPALNRAMQEVGLQLELRRRPVKVLVIDHVERAPVEN